MQSRFMAMVFLILWSVPLLAAAVFVSMVLYGMPLLVGLGAQSTAAFRDTLGVVSALPNSPVTMIAVGDIMLSRHVGTTMAEAADYTLPFSKTADWLASADMTVGNLESPFFDRGSRFNEGMVFKAEPEAVAGLARAGFDVLTLANNHILNQGTAGLEYTLRYLAENHIATVGGGIDFTAAHRPVVVTVQDTRVAFLGYSYTPFHDSPGQTDVVAGMDLEQARQDITAARQQADIVVALVHAGTEYTTEPTSAQQEFDRGLVDAGADLVIGHHPHWPQIIEEYQGKWIFYSLGNFVFDQEWSQETKEGLALEVMWQNKQLQRLRLIPVIIENYSTPRLADEVEAERVLGRIGLTNPVIFSSADLTDQ
ncbi:CapA family protein [Candidatus Falkowbacteria bacterium]|nr:CapA family protein [Candidatus Falkowbacteria bacterium]